MRSNAFELNFSDWNKASKKVRLVLALFRQNQNLKHSLGRIQHLTERYHLKDSLNKCTE